MVRLPLPMLLALLVAFACTGCGATGGPAAFNATFAPVQSPPIDAVAVSLVDQTSLVIGLTIAAADSAPMGISADGADPNAVLATWLGSDCDARLSLVFASTGTDYVLNVHVNPNVAGGFGCQDVSVVRAVTIRFREPLDAARITISQQYP